MNINLIADDSVSSAPAGFADAVQAAANILDQTFIDNITLNIRYGWGSFNNVTDSTLTNATDAVGGPISPDHVDYSTLRSWLSADENSAYDVTAFNSLPDYASSLPGNANNFVVASAQEKAFGHFSGSPNAVDGAIGFGTRTSSSFWEEAALHEIAHAMGRETGFPYEHNVPTLMDLLRYNAPGQFQWGTGQPAYFSIDGGQTDLANFSTISDFGDFAVDSLTPADPFDYKGSNPPVNSLTSLDIEVMDVLGFNTIFAAPTVTAVNLSLDIGQSVPLTNIFSVTSIHGPPTQYQVFFGYPEGGSPAIGSVTLNGAPIAQDQAVTLQNLNGLSFTAAAVHGTDKIWVKAYNGNWSNWTEADITDLGPAPPTVTANNQTVAYNQSVALANIFSVSGSNVSQYQIFFGYPEGGAPALGTVTLNSSPIALDQAVQLSSLTNLTYVGSAVQGTDKIWLRAYDGTWTGWVEADITDPGIAPPAVTPVNQAVANNQAVALTSIFSVSGGVTQYQIWFGYPEGGAPALGTLTQGGAPIPQDQAVALSDLSNLVYTGAAVHGTDKIWLKAYNGIWTNWIEADITDQGTAPPAVTPINQIVAYNQAVALTSIFSVGGGATQYQIWFGYPERGAPALGTLTQGGTPIVQDQAVTLSDLSNLVYTGAAAHGTDKIWLKAYNGIWTNWIEADITDQGIAPPAVTPINQTIAYNQAVALTSIFSVGGGATQYQIWFGYPEGGAPALGTLTQGGAPIAQDQAVTVASLSNLTYTGAAAPGTDKIWIKAYNGIWTNWVEADITDPGNPPPVVTPINQTIAYNQTVAFSSIFSVTGNAITAYQVFFGYPEGGAPALGSVTQGGTPIAQDQAVQVSSLANFAYTGAAAHGTDKIWIKAFNGTWTNWAEADITDPGIGGQLATALAPAADESAPRSTDNPAPSGSPDISLFSNYMASAFPAAGGSVTSATATPDQGRTLGDLTASHA
jgi:hypothetical protein